jgi:hypothetical protein
MVLRQTFQQRMQRDAKDLLSYLMTFQQMTALMQLQTGNGILVTALFKITRQDLFNMCT